MGSLMAGWDSHAKSVKFQRNKSLTNQEIDAYWRSKRQNEEEHLREISAADLKTYGRSNSGPLPRTNNTHQFLDADTAETNVDNLIHTHGWWRSSNWAHLNEPPVSPPERVYKYAPQFHVAEALSELKDSNMIETRVIIKHLDYLKLTLEKQDKKLCDLLEINKHILKEKSDLLEINKQMLNILNDFLKEKTSTSNDLKDSIEILTKKFSQFSEEKKIPTRSNNFLTYNLNEVKKHLGQL